MVKYPDPPKRLAGLTPVAQPVSTYVRPPTPSPSPLHDLAEGLAGLNAGLSSWLSENRSKREEEERLRGEAAFWSANAEGAAEGIRRNAASGFDLKVGVPAFASPHFREGYETAQGQALGRRYEQDLIGAYALWDGKGSSDPAAFDKWFSGFTKQYVPENTPPAVLKGLLPHLRQAAENLHAQNDAARAKRSYEQGVNSSSAAVAAGLDSEAAAMRPNVEAIWSNAMALREQALGVGQRPEDFDEQMFKTFAAKALANAERPEVARDILSLLDKQVPGQSYKFSSTPAGLELKARTEHALEAMIVGQSKEQLAAANAQAERDYKDTLAQVMARKYQDGPNAQVSEEEFRRMEKHNPLIRSQIGDWSRNIAQGRAGVEDPTALVKVQRRIFQGQGINAVMEAINDGILTDPSSIRELSSLADKWDKDEQAKAMMALPAAKNLFNTIRARTTSDADWFAAEGLSEAGQQATADVQRRIVQWSAAHPNAAYDEQQDFLFDLAAKMEKALPPSETPENIYRRPEEFRGMRNPLLPDDEAQQRQGAAADGRQSSPIAPLLQSRQQAPSYASLPEPLRERIAQEAARFKMDPELYTEQLWRNLHRPARAPEEPAQSAPQAPQVTREAPGPQTALEPPAAADQPLERQGAIEPEDASQAQPASFVLDQDALTEGLKRTAQRLETGASIGQLVDEALTTASLGAADASGEGAQAPDASSVPAVRELLDTIASKEAPLGYDQLYSGSKVQAPAPLTTMTVAQVLALQQEMKASGSASTAVGRYQFLRKTLLGLADELSLKGDEVFDEALQDRLALALLEHRGLSRYLAGELSREEFANNLAKEWASLPVVAGEGRGQSYYAGDGLNRSFHDPDAILALVDRLRPASSPSTTA